MDQESQEGKAFIEIKLLGERQLVKTVGIPQALDWNSD